MKRNATGIRNNGFITDVTTIEPIPMRTTCTASKRHFASHSSIAPNDNKNMTWFVQSPSISTKFS